MSTVPSTRERTQLLPGASHPTLDLRAEDDEPPPKSIVIQYFTGNYWRLLSRWRRWRDFMKGSGILLLAASLALFVFAWWRQPVAPRLSSADFLDFIKVQPGLLTSAAALLIMSAILLSGWNRRGIAALIVLALGIGADFYLSGLPRLGVAALAASGLLVLVLPAVKEETFPEAKELERRLDRWTEGLLERAIHSAEALDPSPSASTHLLRCLPKSGADSFKDMLVRHGGDGKPRVTPAGAVAFEFRPDAMVVIECALDLLTDRLLYRNVREFAYDDIVELVWLSEGIDRFVQPLKGKAAAEPAKSKSGMLLAGRRSARGRDLIEIRLSGGRSVSILLRDTRAARGDWPAERGLIEARSKVQAVWQEILAHRRQLRG
jgi:hypothetical protein